MKVILQKLFIFLTIVMLSVYPAIPYLSSSVQAETTSDRNGDDSTTNPSDGNTRLDLTEAEATNKGFSFTSANGAIKITDYSNTESRDVVIPDTIGGLPVTTIGYKAFEENAITAVEFPESLTTIEYKAFYNNQLVAVEFPESLKSIEDWAFAENES